MVISHPFFDVIIWEPSSNYKNHYTLTLMDGQSFDMEKQQSVAPKRMQIPHLCDGSKAILHSHLFWWYNGTFQIISATDVSLYSHPEILNWITRAWSTNHFVWGLFHVDANFRYTKSVVFDFTRPRVLGSAPSWLFKPSLWLTTLVWTLISVSILRAFHPMQTIKQFLYLAPRYVATTRWISGVMWQASFIVVVAPSLRHTEIKVSSEHVSLTSPRFPWWFMSLDEVSCQSCKGTYTTWSVVLGDEINSSVLSKFPAHFPGDATMFTEQYLLVTHLPTRASVESDQINEPPSVWHIDELIKSFDW